MLASFDVLEELKYLPRQTIRFKRSFGVFDRTSSWVKLGQGCIK